MNAVHQFVPRFEPGAVGASALALRDALRGHGYEAEIFADEIDARFANAGARRAAGYPATAKPDDIIVYHLAIGAAMADCIGEWPQRLVIDFHNLTPAEFLEPWDPGLGPAILWGRRQLRDLAPKAALGIAHSEFSRVDLLDAGAPTTTVLPVLLRTAALDDPDPAILDDLRATTTGTKWLFVSRIAPNKAQHDVVQAFAFYRRHHDPDAQLWMVGGSASDTYLAAVRGLIAALELDDVVRLPGAAGDAALAAYYAAADVFVCLSDHEGFAVPVLEAWSHDLAVVAFGAAAVPETAGNAAIVLDDKSPAVVAAAVDRVQRDPRLRTALVERGRRRLDEVFGAEVVRRRWIDAIEHVR